MVVLPLQHSMARESRPLGLVVRSCGSEHLKAPPSDRWACPSTVIPSSAKVKTSATRVRSAPTQLVELAVVDAEMVCDLVDDGDGDLLAQLLDG